VDYLETDSETDDGASPISIVVKLVPPLVNRKQDSEIYQLKYHISEENWELAMELAPNHGHRQEQFQGWVGHPEHELDLGIHGV